ncbi:MAG TPA: diaminopimelate epimerase [Chthonomonadales bacterium]|nr:diaminopimelate epimerase [Chthonomonadales bacterium]
MKFTKMHGIGNDFVVVDCLNNDLPEDELPEISRRVTHRKFGIGGDGLILVLPSRKAGFRMRMFNPDGSEAEMCGNGIRCFAKYVFDRRIATDTTVTVETLAGVKTLKVQPKGTRAESVQVDMGQPVLRRSEIPMRGEDSDRVLAEPLKADGRRFLVTAVSMGNPHAVILDERIDDAEVARFGPLIENHKLFPQRANVQFVQVRSTTDIVVRTWERGAGITLACGTGACASVVAGALSGKTARRVCVHLPGGDLTVDWTGDNRVLMTGPAEEVFEGEMPL